MAQQTTILDVTKSLGYRLMYQPVIGCTNLSQYPLAIRFPSLHPPSSPQKVP